jgi:hypothetical protein
MELTSISNPVDAKASTASNEASNNPRPPIRANPGSTAFSSKSDKSKKQKYPAQCNQDEAYGSGEKMK